MELRPADQLLEQGRKAFQMMIDPANVPMKTKREADLFITGYNRAKRKWMETNPLIPQPFQPAFEPTKAKRWSRIPQGPQTHQSCWRTLNF